MQGRQANDKRVVKRPFVTKVGSNNIHVSRDLTSDIALSSALHSGRRCSCCCTLYSHLFLFPACLATVAGLEESFSRHLENTPTHLQLDHLISFPMNSSPPSHTGKVVEEQVNSMICNDAIGLCGKKVESYLSGESESKTER